MIRRIVLFLSFAALSACSLTQPPVGQPASTPPRTEVPEAGTAEPAVAGVHPAAAQFLADARNWRKLGDDARAAASLERAIRIDPRHPEPWLALARLRLDGGDVAQAENLALKARSLAPRESPWFDDAERMLVDINARPR